MRTTCFCSFRGGYIPLWTTPDTLQSRYPTPMPRIPYPLDILPLDTLAPWDTLATTYPNTPLPRREHYTGNTLSPCEKIDRRL